MKNSYCLKIRGSGENIPVVGTFFVTILMSPILAQHVRTHTLEKNWISVVICRELNPTMRNETRLLIQGIGVLGLAPCHVSENEIVGLQVRPAGQAGYPISLVASLDTVPVKCCVPCVY